MRQYRSRRSKVLLIVGAYSIVALIAIFGLLYTNVEGENTGLIKIVGVLAVMGVAVVVLLYERHAAKAAGLVCPKCKNIFNERHLELLLTTSKCASCGETLVNEEKD